jgi:hypothetical protein
VPYAYTCLVCGKEFDDSVLLVVHFEVEHAELDVVQTWRTFRLEGRRYPRGEKVRDPLSTNLARRHRKLDRGGVNG